MSFGAILSGRANKLAQLVAQESTLEAEKSTLRQSILSHGGNERANLIADMVDIASPEQHAPLRLVSQNNTGSKSDLHDDNSPDPEPYYT